MSGLPRCLRIKACHLEHTITVDTNISHCWLSSTDMLKPVQTWSGPTSVSRQSRAVDLVADDFCDFLLPMSKAACQTEYRPQTPYPSHSLLIGKCNLLVSKSCDGITDHTWPKIFYHSSLLPQKAFKCRKAAPAGSLTRGEPSFRKPQCCPIGCSIGESACAYASSPALIRRRRYCDIHGRERAVRHNYRPERLTAKTALIQLQSPSHVYLRIFSALC